MRGLGIETSEPPVFFFSFLLDVFFWCFLLDVFFWQWMDAISTTELGGGNYDE
jgi:hypothetical protein